MRLAGMRNGCQHHPQSTANKTHTPTFPVQVHLRGIFYTHKAAKAGAMLGPGSRTPSRQTAQGRYLLSDSCIIQTHSVVESAEQMAYKPGAQLLLALAVRHPHPCHAAFPTVGHSSRPEDPHSNATWEGGQLKDLLPSELQHFYKLAEGRLPHQTGYSSSVG